MVSVDPLAISAASLLVHVTISELTVFEVSI